MAREPALSSATLTRADSSWSRRAVILAHADEMLAKEEACALDDEEVDVDGAGAVDVLARLRSSIAIDSSHGKRAEEDVIGAEGRDACGAAFTDVYWACWWLCCC